MERFFQDLPSDLPDHSPLWYPPQSTDDPPSFYPPSNHPLECFENIHQQEASSSPNTKDPFSLRCRIPMPDCEVSGYHLWLETSFVCRRNERERQRVRNVNDGFSKLRNRLPRNAVMRRRQSKVDTLRHAIAYIRQLQTMLEERDGPCQT